MKLLLISGFRGLEYLIWIFRQIISIHFDLWNNSRVSSWVKKFLLTYWQVMPQVRKYLWFTSKWGYKPKSTCWLTIIASKITSQKVLAFNSTLKENWNISKTINIEIQNLNDNVEPLDIFLDIASEISTFNKNIFWISFWCKFKDRKIV